jgi:hypothetical protein
MIVDRANRTNHVILSNGRCSNCNALIASIEDGKLVIKSRIERISLGTGEVQYKCRGKDCRQWLSSPSHKVVFKAIV